MARDRTPYAGAEGSGPAEDDGPAGGGKRHPVCLALGLPLAVAAEGLSAAIDGAALFRRVAGRRAVGAHQSPSPEWRPARPRGARPAHRPASSTASRSRPRKAAVHGALTRARRSRAANATSSPTTGGLLVAAQVHAANIQDRDGAPSVLASIRHAFPWLRHVFADGAYAGPKLAAALERIGRWTLEIVQRPAGARGFDIPTAPLGCRAHTGLVEPQSTARQIGRRSSVERAETAPKSTVYLHCEISWCRTIDWY